MWKRALTGMLGLTLAMTVTACGSVTNGGHHATDVEKWTAPSDLSGSLTYYSANPQGLTDDLVSAFEKKTDVKVNVFSGETGKITAKLKAEQGNPQADVVYLASWSAAQSQSAEGDYIKFRPEGSEKLHKGWASETGDFTGRDGSALALIVNTKALPSEELPSDWTDLTSPAYRDQVIMPDPRESGTAADLIAAMVDSWGEKKTWKLFDALFANGMKVQGANGPALDLVTAGSKAVVFGGVDYSAYAAKQKGEPLEIVMPSSGTTVTPRPVLINEASQNRKAAEAFVNFMFSPEGETISANNYMIPGVTGVSPVAGKTYTDIPKLTEDFNRLSRQSSSVRDTFVARYLS